MVYVCVAFVYVVYVLKLMFTFLSLCLEFCIKRIHYHTQCAKEILQCKSSLFMFFTNLISVTILHICFFLYACLCTPFMAGDQGGQEMVSERLKLQWHIVVSFCMYWEWKLGALEDSSGLLTAKVFSNPYILFLIMFPVQGSLVSIRPSMLNEKQNSLSGERIIIRQG